MHFILGFVNFMMMLTVAVGSIIASKKLFERMFYRVLRNPTSFFETTPNGRLLNRLGKDVDTVDNRLPMVLRLWINCFFRV